MALRGRCVTEGSLRMVRTDWWLNLLFQFWISLVTGGCQKHLCWPISPGSAWWRGASWWERRDREGTGRHNTQPSGQGPGCSWRHLFFSQKLDFLQSTNFAAQAACFPTKHWLRWKGPSKAVGPGTGLGAHAVTWRQHPGLGHLRKRPFLVFLFPCFLPSPLFVLS